MTRSRSEALLVKLDLLLPTLSAVGADVVYHAEPARFYPVYIAAMHGISRAAVPLMECAIQAILRSHVNEPCAGPLQRYLSAHIPEETGHDIWALEDLEAIGVARHGVLACPPSPTIAALVGAQYYWIQHVHPVALMGYLAVMEANPPSMATVQWLEKVTGFPSAAFRSMRIHSKLDIRHRDEVFEVIDALPLDPRLEQMVAISALHTTELLIQALSELRSRQEAPGEAVVSSARAGSSHR